jgi:uncharacterized membrane protein YcaP (DUF421 family)
MEPLTMALWNVIQDLLGLQASTLTFGHMTCRAFVVYGELLLLLRLIGDRRFSGQHAAIDVVLSIILGATLSRGINGTTPFFPTLGVGLVLIGIHALLAALTFRSSRIEKLLKGQPLTLVSQGEVNQLAMRRGHITHSDLASALRLKGQSADLSQIDRASLETSGKISLRPRQTAPQVLDVAVEKGVQTIRIQVEK